MPLKIKIKNRNDSNLKLILKYDKTIKQNSNRLIFKQFEFFEEKKIFNPISSKNIIIYYLMFLLILLLSFHTVYIYIYLFAYLLIYVSIDYVAFNSFSFHIEDGYWSSGCWKCSKRKSPFPSIRHSI